MAAAAKPDDVEGTPTATDAAALACLTGPAYLGGVPLNLPPGTPARSPTAARALALAYAAVLRRNDALAQAQAKAEDKDEEDANPFAFPAEAGNNGEEGKEGKEEEQRLPLPRVASGWAAPSVVDLCNASPAWVEPHCAAALRSHLALQKALEAEAGAGEAGLAGAAAGSGGHAPLPRFWGRLQLVLFHETGRVAPLRAKLAVNAEIFQFLSALLRDQAKRALRARKAQRLGGTGDDGSEISSELIAGCAYFFLHANPGEAAAVQQALLQAVQAGVQTPNPWFAAHTPGQDTPILSTFTRLLTQATRVSQREVLARIQVAILDACDAQDAASAAAAASASASASGNEDGGEDSKEDAGTASASAPTPFSWTPVNPVTGEELAVSRESPAEDELKLVLTVVRHVHPELGAARIREYLMRLRGTWAVGEKRVKACLRALAEEQAAREAAAASQPDATAAFVQALAGAQAAASSGPWAAAAPKKSE